MVEKDEYVAAGHAYRSETNEQYTAKDVINI